MYSDLKRKYNLIDFSISHNELLYRASKNVTENIISNTDIVFKGVISLNTITTFKGIEVNGVNKKEFQTCKVGMDLEPFIFELKDKSGTIAYIEATAMGIFENTLDFGTSSLGDFLWSKENKCIFWSHENAEFKKAFNIK